MNNEIIPSPEMISDHKVRTASVTDDGKRSSFRFDIGTWAALDMVAGNAGLSWVEWAKRAIDARPGATSKASAVRAALTDALLEQQFKSMAEDSVAGHRDISVEHPIVGRGYYCLDDETLAAELESAEISERNNGFEGFTLIVGYRGKSLGGEPFICIENRLKDGLHLFIVRDEK